MNLNFLSGEERIAIKLKSLYQSYGFTEYKLPAFEDYSLYSENQSLLSEKDVITCNAGGKLVALRPDVTLSVVKNFGNNGGTQKLFYHEKVYRKSPFGGEFNEVSQVGVEVIGEIDEVAEAEVCALISKTLSAVDSGYALDVAHTLIVDKILSAMRLSGKEKDFALSCLASKNSHDFSTFAQEKQLSKPLETVFLTLINLPPEPLQAIAALRESMAYSGINLQICELERLINACGGDVNVNFSICAENGYYNGAVFKGYINGVPRAVLSGGRYDKLLDNFGKRRKALGFALYLGELEKYSGNRQCSPDAVIVYNEGSATSALKNAGILRSQGKKVLLSREKPKDFDGKIIFAEADND